MSNKLYLSSSPHFSSGLKTQNIMAAVIISLLPECIYGIYTFGLCAFITIFTSVVSCVLFEFIFQKVTKQKVVISNLSAVVTGLLLALVCPPTVPFWMVIIGAAVAIIFAKGLFGGIGSNVFNPALSGRAFMFISFPAIMGATWLMPNTVKGIEAYKAVDAISSSTILPTLKNSADATIDFVQYFFGNRAGCIGETSIFLILISFIFLLVTKVIDWRAPVSMILTVSICAFLAGFISNGNVEQGLIEVLENLLTGGLVFGATFMVTDYATTPITKPGRLIFGCCCGLITFLIRKFGGYPEGVMFSILIMNSVAPLLNNFTPRMYGYGKKGNQKADTKKINKEFDLKNSKNTILEGK